MKVKYKLIFTGLHFFTFGRSQTTFTLKRQNREEAVHKNNLTANNPSSKVAFDGGGNWAAVSYFTEPGASHNRLYSVI